MTSDSWLTTSDDSLYRLIRSYSGSFLLRFTVSWTLEQENWIISSKGGKYCLVNNGSIQKKHKKGYSVIIEKDSQYPFEVRKGRYRFCLCRLPVKTNENKEKEKDGNSSYKQIQF